MVALTLFSSILVIVSHMSMKKDGKVATKGNFVTDIQRY